MIETFEEFSAKVDERVNAGIALLDRKCGTNWPSQIDIDLLDLGSCDRCILGQLFGDYFEAWEPLDIDSRDESLAHGFTEIGTDDDMWSLLDKTWKDKIAARLG